MKQQVCWLLLLLSAGCQAYKPEPVDLATHHVAWAQRDPASPAVAEYAARLSAAMPDGGVDERFDASDGLTLREARAVALFFNPRAKAARLKAGVAAASAGEAGRWSDPYLQVNLERILEGASHPWVLGGLLNVTIPLTGRLDIERLQASAEASAAIAEAAAEEQRVLAALDTAWTDLLLIDERIALAAAFVTDLQVLASQAERLQAAAELGSLEAGLFRLERNRRQVELQFLQAQRAEKELAAKAALGLKPDAPVRFTLSKPSLLAAANSAAMRKSLLEADHPRIRLAKARYAVAEHTLHLEILRQVPDLTLGGGYGKEEDTRRFLGGLTVPIPMFNRNLRAIAEARAQREAARAELHAEYEELAGSLARAEVLLNAATGKRQAIAKDLAPLADQQVTAARNLGRLGAANSITVLEALTRAHQIRSDLLDATAAELLSINQINALLRPAIPAGLSGKEKP